ncbi:MAG: flagellar basal body rod protein FlgC [Candidatus Zixiibacteriota bacterium]
MSGILGSIGISAKGLSVQRQRMNTVSQNIANAETTETKEGGPYQRQRVLVSEDRQRTQFGSLMKRAGAKLARTNAQHLTGRVRRQMQSAESSAVKMEVVDDSDSSFRLVHDPSHPSADEKGFVKVPDIEIVNEMVDMMAATRAYEANTVAISAAKKMAEDALDI